MKNFIWAIIFLIPIFLSGCSTTHDVASRVKHSQDIATQNNFQMRLVNGGDLLLRLISVLATVTNLLFLY